MDADSKEVANRLLFMKSWSDWKSLDGEDLCLTAQGWALSGTSCKIAEQAEKIFDMFSMNDLKLLVSGFVAGLDQCSTNEYELGKSGLGVAFRHFDIAIKAAFIYKTSFEPSDARQNRLEVNLILGESVIADEMLDVESQSSGSEDHDSMSSVHYYCERLRDYFEL